MLERSGVRVRGEGDCDQFISDAIEIERVLQKLAVNGLQQEILTQEKLAQIAYTLGSQLNHTIRCELLDAFEPFPVDYQVVSKRLNFTDVAGRDYYFDIAANIVGEFLVVARRVK